MHTPQEFSRIKYESSIRFAEQAKQLRATAIANQKVKYFLFLRVVDFR